MDLEILEERQIVETEEFKSFSADIDYLADFFYGLSDLIFCNGHVIYFISDDNFYQLNTFHLDSCAQTLKSIKLCCSIGSFSDANTLARKLRDDLMQFVYILSIINLRKPFNEETVNDSTTSNPEEFVSSFQNLKLNGELNDDEKAVTAWFKNTISDLPWPIRKKLEFENYMKVLKKNDHIHKIISEYNLQKYWSETLRMMLNNYVHNNGPIYSKHNFILAKDKNLQTHLKIINDSASYISSFFVVMLIIIESSLISSTDYHDYIDCDMEPPDGSQYFIASFVQNFIDKKVTKMHPELKQYLKDYNNRRMKIE